MCRTYGMSQGKYLLSCSDQPYAETQLWCGHHGWQGSAALAAQWVLHRLWAGLVLFPGPWHIETISYNPPSPWYPLLPSDPVEKLVHCVTESKQPQCPCFFMLQKTYTQATSILLPLLLRHYNCRKSLRSDWMSYYSYSGNVGSTSGKQSENPNW